MPFTACRADLRHASVHCHLVHHASAPLAVLGHGAAERAAAVHKRGGIHRVRPAVLHHQVCHPGGLSGAQCGFCWAFWVAAFHSDGPVFETLHMPPRASYACTSLPFMPPAACTLHAAFAHATSPGDAHECSNLSSAAAVAAAGCPRGSHSTLSGRLLPRMRRPAACCAANTLGGRPPTAGPPACCEKANLRGRTALTHHVAWPASRRLDRAHHFAAA